MVTQSDQLHVAMAALRGLSGFDDLPEPALKEIAGACVIEDIPRGTALIREGDTADRLYIVIKGRFVVLAGDTPIAEVAKGEPIGELAFFSGVTRTASVVTERRSEVLSLTRSAYDQVAAHTPALSNAILAALSSRLARAIPSAPKLRPRPGSVVAVLPGGGTALDPRFVLGLAQAFAAIRGWRVCRAEETKGDAGAWLAKAEATGDNLVLLVSDPEGEADWTSAVMDLADTIFVVVPRGDAAPRVSALERAAYQQTLSANLHLVLTRETAKESTLGTKAYLSERDASLHHHIALDSVEDFARLGRFMRSSAVGLVLCGGGSFGTAHFGAVKAMQEFGHHFDFYGGTSVGSAMAAALATGLDPDHAMDLCDEFFVTRKVMSKYTIPKHGLLNHRYLDEALADHYAGLCVEDSLCNLFAVSTSLTTNDRHLIRNGPIWRMVRASCAIPGVFPPVTLEDGEVLIDGGLIDNVPLGTMREMKPGPNLVLNFQEGKPWRASARYEDLPTPLEAALSLLRKPKKGAPRHPALFQVLARSMVVNARKLISETDIGDDALMNMPTLKGMSFLDWKPGKRLFEAAYTATAEALAAADPVPENADDATRFSQLRQAAGFMEGAQV